jgi:hypothetical protein
LNALIKAIVIFDQPTIAPPLTPLLAQVFSNAIREIFVQTIEAKVPEAQSRTAFFNVRWTPQFQADKATLLKTEPTRCLRTAALASKAQVTITGNLGAKHKASDCRSGRKDAEMLLGSI